MTRSITDTTMMQIRTTINDHRIAKLTAIAIGLHLIESILPSPLPGVKPGIANIITLYVLYRYDFVTATWVSLLRIFAASLLLGQFLSPTFVLSLGGGLCSLCVLWMGYQLPRRWFGPISLSVLSAFAHIAGQLLIVWWWLIPHTGISYLIPVFTSFALLFGVLNGVVTVRLLHHRITT